MICDSCGRAVLAAYRVERAVLAAYRVEREGEEVWVCLGELTPEEEDDVIEKNRREP